MSEERGRTAWGLWLGVAVSAVCIVLVVRGLEWAELGRVLASARWGFLSAASLAFVSNLLARALRWRAFLHPVGTVSTDDAFAYINIGYLANNVLPMRVGEIIRAVLLGQKRRISRSGVMVTVVVERVFDGLVLVLMTALLAAVAPVPSMVRSAAIALGAGGVAALGVVWWAGGLQERPGWLARLLELLPARLEKHLDELGAKMARGAAGTRSPTGLLACSGYSLGSWLGVLLATYLVMRAVNLPTPPVAALMVVVVLNLGSAVPSSPGYLGVAHFLIVVAITPWGVGQEQAVGFAILLHALSFVVTSLLGAAALWREGLDLRRLFRLGW